VSIDWSAAVTLAALALLVFWPALRALSRKRWWSALAYAVAGPVVVIGPQMLVVDWWEVSHPDQEWSMSAPVWLSIAVSPLATLSAWLIGSWAINAAAGWNAPRNRVAVK
jgi:hypothetical protein